MPTNSSALSSRFQIREACESLHDHRKLQTLLRVKAAHLLDEFPMSVVLKALGSRRQCTASYVEAHGCIRHASTPRELATNRLENAHAERVHVRLEGRRCAGQALGCFPSLRTHHRHLSTLFLFTIDISTDRAEAKVREFRCPVGSHEDVVALEVSVYDAVLMKVLQPKCTLAELLPSLTTPVAAYTVG